MYRLLMLLCVLLTQSSPKPLFKLRDDHSGPFQSRIDINWNGEACRYGAACRSEVLH